MNLTVQYASENKLDSHDAIVHLVTEEGLQECLADCARIKPGHLPVLSRAEKLGDFTGAPDDILFHYPPEGEAITLFVGLGSREKMNAGRFRNAGALLAKRVADLNFKGMALELSSVGDVNPWVTVKPFLEGVAMGAYSFSKYVSQTNPFPLDHIVVVVPDGMDKTTTRTAFQNAAINVNASNISRHLTDEASNFKTPGRFENQIKSVLDGKNLTIRMLQSEDLATENLNLIQAVGQAGSEPPRMMIVERKTSPEAMTLGIVGKAITFDSGGLMIKTHDQMPLMYEDVGGAAAVIGVLSVLDELDPSFNIVAAIPIAENLIDSKAYRPSDVVISRSGLSVEVNNTDAEGRLLLADSFTYLHDTCNIDILVDVATLTGAIGKALGNQVGGFFSNDEALSDLFQEACHRSEEQFWRMPLVPEYEGQLKSRIADMRNDPGEPKALTAALFLNRFVQGNVPWLHLDVGALLMAGSNDILYGGTGFASGKPAMTLLELLRLLNSHAGQILKSRTE